MFLGNVVQLEYLPHAATACKATVCVHAVTLLFLIPRVVYNSWFNRLQDVEWISCYESGMYR